ncbi:MFS transporter [Saccharopolyspora cebuensis]
MGIGVIPTVGVLLAGEITDSDVWAGLARAGSTVGAALAGVPLALLAARSGRNRALSTGWAVAAIGAALLVMAAQQDSATALFIGLLLTGAGTAAQFQARFAATDLAGPAHSGRALATVVWVGSIGSMLGPNLGTPGAALAESAGLAPLGGAFVFAAVALAAAAVLTTLLLRPDPLLAARHHARSTPTDARGDQGRGLGATANPSGRFRDGFRVLAAHGTARTAFLAVVSAQVVMVAIMTMTPVHLAGHGDGLTVIGLTISLHIVGMYALAPVAGWVTDRAGAPSAILVGLVLFAGSFVAAVAGQSSTALVTTALVLLGLGWSFMSVAGSSWLSASVPDAARPSIQGLADASSHLAAATGAFLAGPLMAAVGFDGLSLVAAATLLPVCASLVRRSLRRAAA